MVGLVFRAIKSGSCRRKSLSGINYNCFLRIEIDKILVRWTDFQTQPAGVQKNPAPSVLVEKSNEEFAGHNARRELDGLFRTCVDHDI
jgi:hypothetical protein